MQRLEVGIDDIPRSAVERIFIATNGASEGGCNNPQRQGLSAGPLDGHRPNNTFGGIPTIATDYSPVWDAHIYEWTKDYALPGVVLAAATPGKASEDRGHGKIAGDGNEPPLALGQSALWQSLGCFNVSEKEQQCHTAAPHSTNAATTLGDSQSALTTPEVLQTYF